MSGALAALLVAAGLLALHGALRERCDAALSALTLALIASGTFACDIVLRSRIVDGATFALTALVLLAQERRRRYRAALLAAVIAMALARQWAAGMAVAGWHPGLALLGSRQGLLHLTPVLWLALAGLVLDLRRQPRTAAPAAAAAALLVSLQACCRSPGGGPCPREHLAPLLALLAPALASALRALRDLARRAPSFPPAAAGALLVCWNLLFMQQYALDMIPRDFPLAFPDVARNAAALVARAIGAPLSWPANWAFARRHGVGPERFDAAADKALPRAAKGALTLDVGGRDDEALLLEGWSVRHPCGAGACRAVETSARVLLPVETDGVVALTVRASGSGWLRLAPVHDELGAAARLGPETSDLCFYPEPGRGLRPFTLAVDATAREPPPRALVDALTVSARGCP